MSTFYNGQPVVCVRPREWWTKFGVEAGFENCIPTLNARYIVRTTHYHPASGDEGIRTMELGCAVCDVRGFAPITDKQVRDIIEEAHKMGPWTGGVHWDEKQKAPEDV